MNFPVGSLDQAAREGQWRGQADLNWGPQEILRLIRDYTHTHTHPALFPAGGRLQFASVPLENSLPHSVETPGPKPPKRCTAALPKVLRAQANGASTTQLQAVFAEGFGPSDAPKSSLMRVWSPAVIPSGEILLLHLLALRNNAPASTMPRASGSRLTVNSGVRSSELWHVIILPFGLMCKLK